MSDDEAVLAPDQSGGRPFVEGVDSGTAVPTTGDVSSTPPPVARPAGFRSDTWTVARRASRRLSRDPALLVPALVVPVLFLAVSIGSLQDVAEQAADIDAKAFLLPVAVLLAVAAPSRAVGLASDVRDGRLDRMLVSPVSRPALLVGSLVADVALFLVLSVGVTALGLAVGVGFVTGVGGAALFVALSSLWGLAFAGFPYAVALRTGNPAAVASPFRVLLPFAFLTSALVPLDAMTGWLRAIARWNPVTYLLDGMRTLVSGGWRWGDIGQAFAVVLGVAVVSFTLAVATLGARVRRD